MKRGCELVYDETRTDDRTKRAEVDFGLTDICIVEGTDTLGTDYVVRVM